MTDPGSAPADGPVTGCEDSYERLRRQAMQPVAGADRCGLAVLVRQGITAWLRSLAELPPAPAATRAAPAPARQEAAMIDILLAIARQHFQEASPCSPTTVR